ncbi:Ku protein [Streptomyces crystallinus]|uniref:Ku protein n=1 Tax=Streptomyces crystallinus TaxID=68191 RepID=A0ABN1GHP8_9ACTN
MTCGYLSTGSVNTTIPIKVLPATESHNINFHMIHVEDMGRVRTRKVCELDGKVLDQDQIGKGYEVAKDTIVQITDAELDAMPLPTAKAIEIVAFVPVDSIDPVRVGAGYYLAADGQVAAKPYTVLRQALERSAKVAIAKFAWHNRERLGLLQVKENAIVLHAMRWDDEVRDPTDVTVLAAEVSAAEVEAAIQLLETMEDISDYRDHHRDAVEEMIAAKSEHRTPQPVEPEGPQPSGKVVDLMAALNASAEAAKASRGETGQDASVHELPAKRTAEKTAAKRQASGKAATKRPRRRRLRRR